MAKRRLEIAQMLFTWHAVAHSHAVRDDAREEGGREAKRGLQNLLLSLPAGNVFAKANEGDR